MQPGDANDADGDAIPALSVSQRAKGLATPRISVRFAQSPDGTTILSSSVVVVFVVSL